MAPNPLINPGAERIVLGSILLDPNTFARMDGLAPEDFAIENHRHVFEAMVALFRESKGVDYFTVAERLRARGHLEQIGGEGFLAKLTDEVPCTANAEHYSEIVRKHASARRMHPRLVAAQKDLESGRDPAEVAVDVAEVAALGLSAPKREVTVHDIVNLIEAYQTGRKAASLLTGIEALDRFAPGTDELVVIAARPSMGKTAFAVNLAERLVRRSIPVLFVSAEMDKDAILLRRIASISGITVATLKKEGALDTAQWDRVMKAGAEMEAHALPIRVGGFGLPQLIVTIQREVALHQVKAVFFDHLGKVRLQPGTRHDLAIGQVTEALARLTKDLGITIFLLCQLNRGSEVSGKGDEIPPEPGLKDLRDSGRIEEDADAVWMLWRESYYTDEDTSDEFKILVRKNRNGPIGSATIHFDQKTGRFFE